MAHPIGRLITNIGRAARSPKRALAYAWLRLMPFGIISADPYSRQILTASYGRIPRVPLVKIFPGIESIDVELLRPFEELSETSTDPREIMVVSAIAKFVAARNILEIGTSQGNTTLNLAANTPTDSHITTVDMPPINHEMSLKVPARFASGVTGSNQVGQLFKDRPLSRKITQVLEDSAKIDWKAMPTPFDFVFIDGCHYFDYVVRDTENAVRFTKPGSLIIWHDYGNIKDVSRALARYREKLDIKIVQGTTLAVGRTS